jgi:hypothetical protein
MDQNVKEMIGDLKSYLEYLKGLGITESPLFSNGNEKIYQSEASAGVGAIHELPPPYRMVNRS